MIKKIKKTFLKRLDFTDLHLSRFCNVLITFTLLYLEVLILGIALNCCQLCDNYLIIDAFILNHDSPSQYDISVPQTPGVFFN